MQTLLNILRTMGYLLLFVAGVSLLNFFFGLKIRFKRQELPSDLVSIIVLAALGLILVAVAFRFAKKDSGQ